MRLAPRLLHLAAIVTACSGTPEPLLPVPHPDREGMAVSVAETLERAAARAEKSWPASGAAYGELGQLYLAHSLPETARVCFANASTLEPDEGKWIYLGGVVAEMLGDPAAAATSFARVIALAPDDLAAHIRRGDALLQLGSNPDARIAFAATLARDATSARAHVGLGKVALAERDAVRAREHFERALHLQPNATTLHFLLAEAHELGGDRASAERERAELGEIEVAFPDPAMAEVVAIARRSATLAVIDVAKRPTEFGTAELDWAVTTLGADVPDVIVGAAADLEMEASARARLELVIATLLARRHESGALDHLRRASELDPDFAFARFRLGNTLAEGGRLEEAVAEYDAAIARAESQPASLADTLLDDARLRRATARLELGQFDDALRELRELRARRPDLGGLRIRLATALTAAGQDEQAGVELEAALASELPGGERALALLLSAERLARAGDLDAALLRQREATGAMPGSVDAWRALAVTSAKLGNVEEGAGAFRQLVALRPDDPGGHRGLAASLLQLGLWAEARIALEAAAAAVPADVGLRRVLARLLAAAPDPKLRDGHRALMLADRLMSEAPSTAHAETLAMALAATGEFAAAISLLQKDVAPLAQADAKKRVYALLAAYRARRIPTPSAADLLAP